MAEGRIYGWAGSLLCVTFVLSAALGEWFYKTGVFGLYLTEATLLLSVVAIALAGVRLGDFPWFFWFAGLCSLYLLISLLDDRERYWVVRQGSFLLYLVPAWIFYVLARHGFWSDQRLERLWRLSFWIGLALVGLHVVTARAIPGNGQYSAILLLLTGFCGTLERIQGTVSKIALGALLAAAIAVLIGSVSYWAALLIALFMSVSAFRLDRLLAVGFTSLVLFVVALPSIEGLHDANATWRFVFWRDVVVDSWERSYGLTGRGFGIQYLPESSSAFEDLLAQVTDIWNPDAVHYQLMSVPPHNAILEVLVYLGLPGVLFLLHPWVKGFSATYLQGRRGVTGVLFLQVTVCYVLVSANQGLSVPYIAPFCWAVVGTAMGVMARDDPGGRHA